MQASDIQIGKKYGWRPPGTMDLQRVRIVEQVRPGRWKVEFQDEPHPGLVDYVRSKDLLCRWSDRTSMLRDEKRMKRLADRVAGEWPGPGAYDTAVMFVLDATGEQEAATTRGILSCSPDVVVRLFARIDEPTPSNSEVFVDRHGQMHVGWNEVVGFAQRFADTEPGVVLRTIESEERELAARGYEPGESWSHEYLRELGPAFALVRQWLRSSEQLVLHEELDRVRTVAWKAIYELRSLGHDRAAARVERALRGG